MSSGWEIKNRWKDFENLGEDTYMQTEKSTNDMDMSATGNPQAGVDTSQLFHEGDKADLDLINWIEYAVRDMGKCNLELWEV